ncbi:MAG: alpha/beta hydrolase family protein [Candidatus Nanopelagicales bacterium]
MSTFVLVPGAFHGGWVWAPVAEELQRRGHSALPVTLTGLGERRHLASPEVGVDTHIADVVNTLVYRDLSDVTLVLHSYSGVLAGPVAEQAQGRVTGVVLAAGFLAHPGESNFTVEPADSRAAFQQWADEGGDGWRIPVQRSFLERWGITDPALAARVWPRLTDFPLRCSTEPVAYDPRVLAGLPRTYIEHTAPPLPALDLSIARARDEGWSMRAISAGHDFMLEKPMETADLLGLS